MGRDWSFIFNWFLIHFLLNDEWSKSYKSFIQMKKYKIPMSKQRRIAQISKKALWTKPIINCTDLKKFLNGANTRGPIKIKIIQRAISNKLNTSALKTLTKPPRHYVIIRVPQLFQPVPRNFKVKNTEEKSHTLPSQHTSHNLRPDM